MSQTPTTRRQLRERATPTEKDDGRRRGGVADRQEDTPGGASGVKIRTRLSTGTLIMNGTSTLKESDLRTPPSTPTTNAAKALKDGSGAGAKRRAASSGASSEPHPAGPPPKLRKVVGGDGQEEGDQNDYYCWLCHKEGGGVYCQLCPRTYHLKCLGSASVPKEWVCVECEKVMRAECTDTCSTAMGQITTDTLCLLLRYALDRMRQPGSEIFQKPVDSADIPNYSDYIFHPMDFTVLEKNIKKKEYGCTEGFLADAKWILHNCIIFNGLHHKLTTVARNVVKSCKHEMTEIEVCPQCYEHSCVHGDSNWFIEPCDPPHTLVWAKLKGYPFWPAKALQEVKGQVDVRFFGAHDMSWIPLSQVFLLSMEPPTGVKNKKGGFGTALDEMEEHIQLIREKYGSFDHAPYRTPYDRRHVYMNNKLKCVNMMAAKRFKASSCAKVGSRGKDAEKVSALAKTASALKSKYNTIANKKSVTGQGQGRNQHLFVRQSSSSCESSPEKVVRDSNERTPFIMTARMRASKSLLLSPRVNVTDIIQEKIYKQKEQDREGTEEGWGETESSSAVERDGTGTFQKGCAESKAGQSQNVKTELAGDAGRTDMNTVTNNPQGESNKQEEEAVLKENSVAAAKKIAVGCEKEAPVATSKRNPDSDSVDSEATVTDNEFSNDGSSTSSKDAKTSANSVNSFVEAEKVTAQTAKTGAENVAGVKKLAVDRVTGADTTPASTQKTVREENATGVRQVPVVEERSQGISASSECNSSSQASSSINAGAKPEATSFQSKAGNSPATAAKDNAATISIDSSAAPVTPSASSVKSLPRGSVPKETVWEETVCAALSPKTGVEYKHSLLKTIEACKGKLGITGDAELAEPMEVSDDEEDSSDDNKGTKKEGGDGRTTSDCRASSEQDAENVTAVSDDGNNRERRTDSKDTHDREDLTETTGISSRSGKVRSSSDSGTLSPASVTGDLDTVSGDGQNKTNPSSKPNASGDGSDASLLPSKEGGGSHGDHKVAGQQSTSDCSSDGSLLRQAYSAVKGVSMTPSHISDMARPVSAEWVMSGSVSSKGTKLTSLLSDPAASSTQSVSESFKPVTESSKPVSESSKPVTASSTPVLASSKPVSAFSKSGSTSSKPVSASSKPVSAFSKSGSTSSKPVSASSKPISASSKPVSVSPSTPVCAPSMVNTVKTGLFRAASPQDPAEKVSVVRTVLSDPVSVSVDAKTRTCEERSRSDRAVSQAKAITIDDDDDEPGLLMEVESEGERDSLIIDLDEDDLDLNESGSKSKETTQTFVRELAPSPAVIENLQKASRLQADILRNRPPPVPSNKPFVTIPASVQKLSTDTSQPSSSVPSQPSVSSPPCVMIDVRSLSGLEHEWNDESVPTTAPPRTQSATKTRACPPAQSARTPSQPPLGSQEFRVPPTPSTEQTRQTPPAASPSPAPTQGSAQRSRSGSSIGASEEDTVEAERTLTPAAISLVNKYSQQLVHNTQYQLAEMCREILAAAPDKKEHERHLQEAKEHLQWTHEQQVAEIQHNFKMTIAEMKACWEAEKSKALNDLKKKLTKEKDEAVAAAKKKQWCAHCWKEAMYYCCWNTSYCTYDCQQSHWNAHQTICRQAIDVINAATATADATPTPTPDASLLSTAATVSLSDKGLSALEEEKLKAQKFNLPNPNIRQAISLQTDEAWRNRLPLPSQTLGMGHNIHFLPAQQHQQPQQAASQPLQQLQYLHSLGATAPATFQTNSQVQLLTQRPAINTMLPTGAVMPGNAMVFPILRSSQPGSLPGTQNVVLNRPMHYPMWKHC